MRCRREYIPSALFPLPNSLKACSLGYCDIKWAEAIALCEQHLSETEREDLKSIQTLEDLKKAIASVEAPIAQTTEPALLQKLGPLLHALCDFVALLTTSLSSHPTPTAILWGLVSLLIRVRSLPLRSLVRRLTCVGCEEDRDAATQGGQYAAGPGTRPGDLSAIRRSLQQEPSHSKRVDGHIRGHHHVLDIVYPFPKPQ